ncbi:hypothetical protein Tco_1089013 [Tanacetum coccineum]
MPNATTTDVSLTKSYIPKVSKILGISLTIAQFYKPIENRNIHEAVFTNEWDLASLEYSQETEGPYYTDLPTPDDIRRLLELERVVVDRTIKSQAVALNPNQILTKELSPGMKQWEEIIRENVFGLGGHRDRLPAYLAHMLYCVVAEEQYNLAYFFVKRIKCARATPTANLPYGMFLTRVYRYVMETYPHLYNGTYDIVELVMRPLALRQTRRPRSDRGKSRHPSLQPLPIITLDLRLTKEMMMRIMVHLVLVPNLIPPILTLFIHLPTKTTICLPLPSKPIKLSLHDKPPCSTERNKCMRRCTKGSSHLEKH